MFELSNRKKTLAPPPPEVDLEFLQESILIAFDFIWKILLSGRNFATLPYPLLLRKSIESIAFLD